jgi:outer membrane protein assembly factor BamB
MERQERLPALSCAAENGDGRRSHHALVPCLPARAELTLCQTAPTHKVRMNSRIVFAAFFSGLALAAHADWLHYRGPTFNGAGTEKIPAGMKEPKQLWKVNVGIGTAAVTVAGNRAFTSGNYDKKNDVLVCLDTANGKGIWRHEYAQPLDPNMFEGGPRSTPTIDGEHVYSLASDGDLLCLDAASGKVKWRKHLQKDFGGRKPGWGYAGSPTIEDNLVIVDSGGSSASTLALNKATGEPVWKSGSDPAGYGTPVVATINGKRTVVMFKAKALVGLDAKDGQELWRTEWKTDYDVNAATPIVFGNSVFVTSGYGTGAAVFDIGASGATQKWRNKSLRGQINTP